MSRSAAARSAHDRAARAPRTPAVPRRVSGPAHPPRPRVDAALAMSEAVLAPHPVPRPRTTSRPPLRLAAGGASIALRVAEAALEVSGSRTMDRLVRSRAWVVIVAFGLIGIVAMQVSMLKLNNGIGRAVETAATLERSNVTLREEVSRLSAGDRIQALAGARGFVMPEPGDVTYLNARSMGSDAARAARRMRAPDPQLAGPAGSPLIASALAQAPGSAAAGTATQAGATSAAPAAAVTDPAAAPAGTTATGSTGAAGTTAPAGGATAPPQTAATATAPPPTAATPTVPAAPVAAPTSSGEVAIP